VVWFPNDKDHFEVQGIGLSSSFFHRCKSYDAREILTLVNFIEFHINIERMTSSLLDFLQGYGIQGIRLLLA